MTLRFDALWLLSGSLPLRIQISCLVFSSYRKEGLNLKGKYPQQALSRPRCEIAAGPSTFIGDGSALHGDEVRVVVPSRLGESLEERSSARS